MDQRMFPGRDPVAQEHVITRPEGEWLRERDPRGGSLAPQRGHDPHAPGPFRRGMAWHTERDSEQRECSDRTPCVHWILLQPDRTTTRRESSSLTDCECPVLGKGCASLSACEQSPRKTFDVFSLTLR